MMADATPITEGITEEINEEISDGDNSVNGDSKNDVNLDDDSYAARAARNLSRDDDASSEDLSHSHTFTPRHFHQYRFLSDFEKEHFHPTSPAQPSLERIAN